MLNRALVTFCTLALAAVQSLANPSGINISGKIAVQGTNSPLASSDVDFRIRVLSPTGCVLYTERFDNVDLASSAGVFNLTIGQGVVDYNAWDSNPATRYTKTSLIKVFSNASTTIVSGLSTYGSGSCIGGQYDPQDGDVRQIVIEFDPSGSGIPANYVALSPYHQIRSVPYAMLADQAADADQLGGVPADQYAKTADLATAVPSSETDPHVQAFAKTAITGLTAGQCGAGKILTFNGTSLECVTDGGSGGGTLSPATDTVLGGVMVPSASYLSIDGSGNVDVKDLPISKITGLQTALNSKFDASHMPTMSCATGEALVWQSPTNTFACDSLSLTASQISDFNTAVDARITAGDYLPKSGGTMTGSITMSGADINIGNNMLSNVGYLHFQNKAADPVFSAANNGYVWYNSTDKKLKFNDGTQIQELAIGGGGATGSAGGDLAGTYPNPTLAVLGAGGTGTKITYDTKGRVTASGSLADTDIPALDAAKITTGQFGDARLSDISVDKITSASGKYFTYAPNGTACATGEILKKTTNGWECAADAGAGGADASSIDGVTVDTNLLATNHFLQYDGTKWTNWQFPTCGTNSSLQVDIMGNISCTAISGLTNSQIDAAAAIARSKLANGTANHVLINDGSGVMSSEAQLSVSRGGTGIAGAYADGQLLIGKSDGTLAKANLTAGSGVSITNGDGSITITSTGSAPTGTAGGDLDGTYPSPTLAVLGAGGTGTKITYDTKGRVTASGSLADTDIPALDAAKITTGQFGDARLSDISVDKITSASGKYFTYAPNGTACATGEILKKTTNGWECAADSSGAGTVTSVTSANTDISVTNTTTTPVLTLNTGTNAGQILKFLTNATLPALDGSNLTNLKRANIDTGSPNHVLINNGAGEISSEAQLATVRGGTGQTSYSAGELLIGKSDGTLAKANLTQGSGITITNGDGTITIASSVSGGLSAVSNTASLANGKVWIGDGTGKAQEQTLSGDLTIDSAGVATLNTVAIAKGGTGQTTKTAAFNALSPLTTAGDIAVHNGTDSVRLPVGANGQTLVADDSVAAGIKWAPITASDIASIVDTGIVQRTAPGTYTALGLSSPLAVVGSNITVGTELTGLGGLSTDGYIYRNGLGTYATKAGSDTAANSTVVTRGPSGISGFNGVTLTNGATNVTQNAASGGGAYSLTWPNALPGASGKVLSVDTSGVLSWIDMSGGGAGTVTSVTSANTDISVTDTTTTPVLTLNTGTNAGQILKFATNATLPALNGSALTNLTRANISTGTANHVLINDSSGAISSEAQLAVTRGGTGQSSFTNGQILIGKTTGNTLVKSTLTAGSGISITNGSGSITISASGDLPGLTSAKIWVGDSTGTATERSPAGDVTMNNTGSFTVAKIQGTAVSGTTPTTGQVLQYSGSNWAGVSPTISGAINSILKLDGSGIATAIGVAIKGATTGIVTLQAPNSFSNYSLTLPSDTGAANQVLTTNGSGTLTWTSPTSAPTMATKTADFTVQTTENNYFYLISNPTTATLPAVASVPAGFQVAFKRMGSHNVNINASGSETIDGANQRSLASTYQSMTIVNTGTEWVIVGGGAAATSPGCVPGSQSFNSTGIYSFSIDASKASLCKFTITVQGGAGATSVAPSASGGRGGALRFVYTASGAGNFEVLVGGAGANTGSPGYGGGGTGGQGTVNKGAGGGGASAVRFTTSAPTDTLLAVAGGGGGAGAYNASNSGGAGGGTGGGSNGVTSGSTEYGRAGINNVGGAGGVAASYAGGAGGSSGADGSAGQNTYGGAGGTGIAAFSVAGGGGGSTSSSGNNGAGGGGGGYGGGGGGAGGASAIGGGAGGGGYISPSVDSFTSLTGPSAGNPGSVLIEWN